MRDWKVKYPSIRSNNSTPIVLAAFNKPYPFFTRVGLYILVRRLRTSRFYLRVDVKTRTGTKETKQLRRAVNELSSSLKDDELGRFILRDTLQGMMRYRIIIRTSVTRALGGLIFGFS